MSPPNCFPELQPELKEGRWFEGANLRLRGLRGSWLQPRQKTGRAQRADLAAAGPTSYKPTSFKIDAGPTPQRHSSVCCLVNRIPPRGRVRARAIVRLAEGGGDAEPFWQRRFYDFNVWSAKKLPEKLDYRHANPVHESSSPIRKIGPGFQGYGAVGPNYEKGADGLMAIDSLGEGKRPTKHNR